VSLGPFTSGNIFLKRTKLFNCYRLILGTGFFSVTKKNVPASKKSQFHNRVPYKYSLVTLEQYSVTSLPMKRSFLYLIDLRPPGSIAFPKRSIRSPMSFFSKQCVASKLSTS
jgi:hypothetical protein